MRSEFDGHARLVIELGITKCGDLLGRPDVAIERTLVWSVRSPVEAGNAELAFVVGLVLAAQGPTSPLKVRGGRLSSRQADLRLASAAAGVGAGAAIAGIR
ncbi:MAG: hypothetical protein QOH21_3102 [Acidobacteriota bacterium]|jgi:hypothetical protein|nr:hypothetical protein [Acidobacteriota bacterium]